MWDLKDPVSAFYCTTVRKMNHCCVLAVHIKQCMLMCAVSLVLKHLIKSCSIDILGLELKLDDVKLQQSIKSSTERSVVSCLLVKDNSQLLTDRELHIIKHEFIQ